VINISIYKRIEKWIPYCSILLYIILFIGTYHWYQFHFDIDGVGYMAVAKHITNKEWHNSINGIWSPLNCWIAGFAMNFIKNPIFVFKLINAICSVVVIMVVNSICSKLFANLYPNRLLLKLGIILSLPVILLSFTHHQLAGDLLQLVFVLLYFNLLISKDFFLSVNKNMLAGFVMALAYLAKAYNLPFFIIAHLSVYLLFFRVNQTKHKLVFLMQKMLPAYFIFLIAITPWVIALSLKYNHFTFSTVSTFNMHWVISKNIASSMQSANFLLPPPYPSSATMWEDPYLYYNFFEGPFSSGSHFLLFLKTILHNIKIFIKCMTDISFLSVTVLSFLFIRILQKRQTEFLSNITLVLIFFSITGYLLIYIETRYLWFAGLLSLILGGKILTSYLHLFPLKSLRLFLCIVFLGSYLIYPADRLQDMKKSPIDLPFYMQLFKNKQLYGNFTASCRNGNDLAVCYETAFLTNTRFYLHHRKKEESNLLQAIQKQNINFYFYFYTSDFEKEGFLNSQICKEAKEKIIIAEKQLIITRF
jgi:hypothetical protein